MKSPRTHNRKQEDFWYLQGLGYSATVHRRSAQTRNTATYRAHIQRLRNGAIVPASEASRLPTYGPVHRPISHSKTRRLHQGVERVSAMPPSGRNPHLQLRSCSRSGTCSIDRLWRPGCAAKAARIDGWAMAHMTGRSRRSRRKLSGDVGLPCSLKPFGKEMGRTGQVPRAQ